MRESAIALALAATLVLAGCAGGPGTATNATDASNGTEPTTSTTAATTTDSSDDDANDSEADVDVDADALAASAASSLASTQGVVVEGNLTRTTKTASGARTVTATFTERVDGADRELAVERTVAASGGTVETATYLVNGTLYERNPAFERQYGTEWVRVDGETAWANASSTAVVARMANASDAAVAGTTTVDGERAVVLALDVNASELAALSGLPVDANRTNALSGTLTVDPDSGRVHAATVHVNVTVENQFGDSVTLVTNVTRRFVAYEPVSVTLPDGADDAAPIGGNGTRVVAPP